MLAHFVDVAKTARDAESFCTSSFLGEACEADFVRAGGSVAVPSDEPEVVATRSGGPNVLVLVVCGIDGRGTSYRSDFPVERDGASLRATLPVYWAGVSFSGSHGDPTGPVGTAAGTAPAGC